MERKLKTKMEVDIKEQLDRMEKEIHSIKRGVYGDPINKVKGLIDTDISHEDRIQKLEELKKRFFWLAAGFILAVELILDYLIEMP